jgi:hypothetical protein
MFRLLFVLYKRGLPAFTIFEAVICCLAYRVDQLFTSLIAPMDIFSSVSPCFGAYFVGEILCGRFRIYLLDECAFIPSPAAQV